MSASKALTAQEILECNDVTIERVEVPEWGGHIHVRTMSGIQKENYIKSLRKIVGYGDKQTTEMVLEKSSAKLVQKTACDEQGNLLFTLEQVDALSKKSSAALRRVVEVAAKLNGIGEQAAADSKNDSEDQEATDDSSID